MLQGWIVSYFEATRPTLSSPFRGSVESLLGRNQIGRNRASEGEFQRTHSGFVLHTQFTEASDVYLQLETGERLWSWL